MSNLTQHNLTVNNISKSYKGRSIICDVSISVKSSEIVGLLGPNGAGKTTCFYIVSGLIKTDSGSIFLDDKNISKLSIDKRALLGISYLSQETSIFRGLSVEDNIAAVLQTNRKLDKKQIKDKVDELLTKFKITHISKLMGIALSGGERRRVEIARVLAMNPKFVLLDEPFAGIDPIAVADLQNLIYGLKDNNIGVLITDHNFRELLDTCDHSYVLSDGNIIANGDKKNILKNNIVQQVYLGESNANNS